MEHFWCQFIQIGCIILKKMILHNKLERFFLTVNRMNSIGRKDEVYIFRFVSLQVPLSLFLFKLRYRLKQKD